MCNIQELTMACGEGKLMTNLNILALKKAQLVSDVLDLKKPQFLLTMLISNISYFKKSNPLSILQIVN